MKSMAAAPLRASGDPLRRQRRKQASRRREIRQALAAVALIPLLLLWMGWRCWQRWYREDFPLPDFGPSLHVAGKMGEIRRDLSLELRNDADVWFVFRLRPHPLPQAVDALSARPEP